MSIALRFLPNAESTTDAVKVIMKVDILSITAVITVWTAVITIAIGCWVVVVMRGPAYRADCYKIPDADRPPPRQTPGELGA